MYSSKGRKGYGFGHGGFPGTGETSPSQFILRPVNGNSVFKNLVIEDLCLRVSCLESWRGGISPSLDDLRRVKLHGSLRIYSKKDVGRTSGGRPFTSFVDCARSYYRQIVHTVGMQLLLLQSYCSREYLGCCL